MYTFCIACRDYNCIAVSADLPPPYPSDQQPPSYEDVCPSGDHSNNTPSSYVDTLPPHHISPLPTVATDTAVPPVVTQNSPESSLRTHESDQVKCRILLIEPPKDP